MTADLISESLRKMQQSLARKRHNTPGACAIFLKHWFTLQYEASFGKVESQRLLKDSHYRESVVHDLGELVFSLSQDDLIRVLQKSGIPDCRPEHFSSDYLKRVAQQALESLEATSACPELLIEPVAGEPNLVNPKRLPIHAVLFEWFPHFTNEFYALAVDAFSSDLDHFGKPKRLLVGAHESWLTEGGVLRRCLWWTGSDDDVLIESDIEPGIAVDCVHTICASPQAHARVHDWCVRYAIPQVNPYPESAVADDKHECFRRWKAAGVPTPETLLLDRGMAPEDVQSVLGEWLDAQKSVRSDPPLVERIFVQPNLGTEGRGVHTFEIPSETQKAARYASEIASTEPVIVRPSCGNVSCRDDTTGEVFACDLRLNVGFNGTTYTAESGYLQVASSPSERIVSAGRGGRVMELHKNALGQLVTEEGTPIAMNAGNFDTLKNIASKAAEAIGGIALVGVDLKLLATMDKHGEIALSAFVLDINPRPAGLMHSDRLPVSGRLIAEINSEHATAPCISPGMWLASLPLSP